MNDVPKPFKSIQLDLSDELIQEIKQMAKKNRIGFQEAVNLCYSVGMGLASEASEAWKEAAKKEGLMDELESLREIRTSKVRSLMDLRSKCSSKKYNLFEEFNKVSTDLLRYSGRLAEARLYKTRLEKRGVKVSIEQCLIPNLEELNLRYLFRSRKGSEDIPDHRDEGLL